MIAKEDQTKMQQKDDLEAVRTIVTALEGFAAEDQERILRWVREKTKLPIPAAMSARPQTQAPQQPVIPTPASTPTGVGPASLRDLKSFVSDKKPKSDVQFAATVAYYYRFEATIEKRKEELNSEDLQEACRLASRERLKNPGQTLRNAHQQGLLDKGSQAGSFAINSVGENLVAMTLPTDRKVRAQAKKGIGKNLTNTKKKPSARKTGKK